MASRTPFAVGRLLVQQREPAARLVDRERGRPEPSPCAAYRKRCRRSRVQPRWVHDVLHELHLRPLAEAGSTRRLLTPSPFPFAAPSTCSTRHRRHRCPPDGASRSARWPRRTAGGDRCHETGCPTRTRGAPCPWSPPPARAGRGACGGGPPAGPTSLDLADVIPLVAPARRGQPLRHGVACEGSRSDSVGKRRNRRTTSARATLHPAEHARRPSRARG